MSEVRKNISNLSWLLCTRILRILISIVVSIWVARYLGPSDYGLLNYILALVALISIFSSLGLEQIFVKKLLENKDDENILLGSAFLLKLIGSLLLIIVALGISVAKGENETFIILTSLIAMSYIFKAFEVLQYWFEAHLLSKKSSKVDLYVMVFSSLLKVLLIVLDASLTWFAFSILLEAVVMAIGLIIIYRKEQTFNTWKISLSYMKNLLIEAWPLILAGALFTIYTKVDQIMLGDMKDNHSVGIYVAAVVLSQGWLFLPSIIGKAFYPMMIKAKKVNRQKYLEITQHLLNLITFVAVFVSAFIALSSYFIIAMTFGDTYALSAPILALHVWGGVFTAMSAIAYRYFISENLQKTSFYRGLVGLVVNVSLNFILIPIYGGFGAAIATVISLALSLYGFNAFTKSTREMFRMQTKALLLFHAFGSMRYLKNVLKTRNQT